MVRYTCAKCGEKLETENQLAGQPERCPVCKHGQVVPHRKRLTSIVFRVALGATAAAALVLGGVLLGALVRPSPNLADRQAGDTSRSQGPPQAHIMPGDTSVPRPNGGSQRDPEGPGERQLLGRRTSGGTTPSSQGTATVSQGAQRTINAGPWLEKAKELSLKISEDGHRHGILTSIAVLQVRLADIPGAIATLTGKAGYSADRAALFVAMIQAESGDLPSALARLQEIRLPECELPVLISIISFLNSEGQTEQAENALKLAAQRCSAPAHADPRLLSALAVLQATLGHPEAAADAWAQAIALARSIQPPDADLARASEERIRALLDIVDDQMHAGMREMASASLAHAHAEVSSALNTSRTDLDYGDYGLVHVSCSLAEKCAELGQPSTAERIWNAIIATAARQSGWSRTGVYRGVATSQSRAKRFAEAVKTASLIANENGVVSSVRKQEWVDVMGEIGVACARADDPREAKRVFREVLDGVRRAGGYLDAKQIQTIQLLPSFVEPNISASRRDAMVKAYLNLADEAHRAQLSVVVARAQKNGGAIDEAVGTLNTAASRLLEARLLCKAEGWSSESIVSFSLTSALGDIAVALAEADDFRAAEGLLDKLGGIDQLVAEEARRVGVEHSGSTYPRLRAAIGGAMARAGRLAEAKAMAAMVLPGDPTCGVWAVEAYVEIARAELKEGSVDAAYSALIAAQKASGGEAFRHVGIDEILGQTAMVAARKGNTGKATDIFNEIVNDWQKMKAAEALVTQWVEAGKLDEAEAWCGLLRDSQPLVKATAYLSLATGAMGPQQR